MHAEVRDISEATKFFVKDKKEGYESVAEAVMCSGRDAEDPSKIVPIANAIRYEHEKKIRAETNHQLRSLTWKATDATVDADFYKKLNILNHNKLARAGIEPVWTIPEGAALPTERIAVVRPRGGGYLFCRGLPTQGRCGNLAASSCA